MASPFPGMDPYLESHWRDIHARLIIYACDALQGVLPGCLTRPRRGERFAGNPHGSGRSSAVSRRARCRIYVEARAGIPIRRRALPWRTPLLVDTERDPATETFLEIIDRESGNRVVTVIEFLSPSNKSPGPNREQYLRKQREVCSSDANLVEIDLNRFGTHTLAFPLAHIKPQGRTAYMASVRRATLRGKAEVYPMPLWERLPILNIPLRPDDDDVPLDLQSLVDQCYRNGAYEGTLNYAIDPDPPLLGAEKDWAEAWLSEKGLRPAKKAMRRKEKPK